METVNKPDVRRLAPAAQYVRMSTEHQRYSIEHQTLANAAYAIANGLEIVRTYADAGISGLTLDRRDGLKRLLADVLGGQANFSVILVYDVSRWGRFQDPDESAHYEYLCKAAGVRVAYCAELFANDGSLTSTLVKHLKRAMAAEFSRELSDKIVRAKDTLGRKGYWPGGNPGFGLRRCAVDHTGQRQLTLQAGEANALKGNRIVVVAGPANEVAIVRRIFRMFTTTETTPRLIARALNCDGVLSWRGGVWTESRVRRVLQNELYVGARLLGKTKTYLGQVERRSKQDWVRIAGACRPIIQCRSFEEAARRTVHLPRYSKESLLADLRRLLAEKGKLSFELIRRDPRTASPSVYRHRFGSLLNAYALIDYTMTPEQQRLTRSIAPHRPHGSQWNRLAISDDEIVSRLAALRREKGGLSLQLIEVTPGLPRRETLIRRFGSVQRAYELAGYSPGRRQQQCFERTRARSPDVRAAIASEGDYAPLE
jgi:DNA invertase Pin-like site-specific DNA recombinase